MTNPANDNEACPRNFTREQLVEGLKAGRTFWIDRRDAPELTDVAELKAAGLVVTELLVWDEQSSALRVRWKE